MSPSSVNVLVQAAVAGAGLDGGAYSAHSCAPASSPTPISEVRLTGRSPARPDRRSLAGDDNAATQTRPLGFRLQTGSVRVIRTDPRRVGLLPPGSVRLFDSSQPFLEGRCP